MLPILSVGLATEQDIVAARQRARQIAGLVGFDLQDQVRIATGVSEIARNAFRYADGGTVTFAIEGSATPQFLRITVADSGPGVAHADEVLAGRYRSNSGMGLGIVGTRRLMDRFHLETVVGKGTTVTFGKRLPGRAKAVGPGELRAMADRLAAERPSGPLDEVQAQNQELLRSLDELRRRQEDLERLNDELADTNRGVVALYAELDEKAEHLRRADAMKSRFLSNMSHEFRTPLNSMLALTQLLCDRADGDLTSEQETQVRLIRRAAQDLSELVSDLLDLARVEAGKIAVRPAAFEVGNLFGALRGMLRPLLVSDAVRLVFEEPVEVPPLISDEGKVSQILRNFISNALKFTERGEVRVRARQDEAEGTVTFSVSDTGIGIAPEDQERIFLEFTQLESPLQGRVRGTGLGLPLSRRLAELLGGRLDVSSAPGLGSTFSVTIPTVYGGADAETGPEPAAMRLAAAPSVPEPLRQAPSPRRVLLVDDDERSRYVLRHHLTADGWQVVEAASGREGLDAARQHHPDVVFLDLLMPGMVGGDVLVQLREDPSTRDTPVIIATSRTLDAQEVAALERQRATVLPKAALGAADASLRMREAMARAGVRAAGTGVGA